MIGSVEQVLAKECRQLTLGLIIGPDPLRDVAGAVVADPDPSQDARDCLVANDARISDLVECSSKLGLPVVDRPQRLRDCRMQGCGVFREVLNVPGEVDQGRVIEGVGHQLAGLVHSERAPVGLRPAGRTRLRPPWAAYPGLHKALVIGEQRVQQILEFADLDAAEHDPRVEDLLLALRGFQWPRGPRVWLGVAFEHADGGPAVVVAQGHVRQLEAIKIGPRLQGRHGIAG